MDLTHQLPLDDKSNVPTRNSRSSSSSSTSSAPQYSDENHLNYPNTNVGLIPSQSSGSSSTKTCEVDIGEDERDTFSPVSSNSPSDGEATNHDVGLCFVSGSSGVLNTTIDNKTYERLPTTGMSCLPSSSASVKKNKLLPTDVTKSDSANSIPSTSKEEKQRHNEEIVIMETSSVSSETGSWESIFPQSSSNNYKTQSYLPDAAALDPMFPQNDLKAGLHDDTSAIKLSQDQNLQIEEVNIMSNLTVNIEADSTLSNEARANAHIPGSFNELSQGISLMNTSGSSACFIDASSLRDDDEVESFPSVHGLYAQKDVSKDEMKYITLESSILNESESSDREIVDESPTKKLESFHKSFAKCKSKPKDQPLNVEGNTVNFLKISNSSSISNSFSEAESLNKGNSLPSSSSFTHNLSDEEKLWKRVGSFSKNTSEDNDRPKGLNQAHEDTTEVSDSLLADIDSSDCSYKANIDRPNDRHYETFNANSNQIHFNVHPLGVSPKFTQHCAGNITTLSATANASAIQNIDLSYTTDYSSSSPAPSLLWSEHEQRTHESDSNTVHINKTSLFPDTPHNSIVHMDIPLNNNFSMQRDSTFSSSLSHQRDSGSYCSDATDSPIFISRTPKRSKFDESNPIVSGGVSVKDFHVKQCESPPVKRRTDTCPIVSGGFVSLDFEETRPLDNEDSDNKVELRQKPILRKPLPGIASWVVDMSDCRSERRKSSGSVNSLENLGPNSRERSDSNSSHKSGCGFYVPLENSENKSKKAQMSKSFTSAAHPNDGYNQNLSFSECHAKDDAVEEKDKDNTISDKKNIFSMFINIGDKKSKMNNRKDGFNLPQRLTLSAGSCQKKGPNDGISDASSTETLLWKSTKDCAAADHTKVSKAEQKPLEYKNNLESPITVAAIRRLSQQRTQGENTKRHSWGTSLSKEPNSNSCKRSISLIANNGDAIDNSGNGLMSIIDKLPLISKTSTLSIDSSISPNDEYTCSKSGRSSNSNNSNRNSISGNERDDEGIKVAEGKMKKRRKDVQINETFDKSSIASVTDGVFSKDLSPGSTTDTDDLTFQQDEEIALREACFQSGFSSQIPSNRTSAVIMETIIEAKEGNSPKKNLIEPSMETLHATIEKQKMLLETVNENQEQEKSSFVKLSDMDKPVKLETHFPEAMSKSVGNHRQLNRLFRDESRTRPHSWTMTRSTGNSFLNITNSVDNIRSLNRLFPNFSKEFSSSLPNDIILDQIDYVQTDISADSSLASSFSRSGMDESSISCRQPRRLGEDLLKMFLQEIATDMIVEVHGRRIKAHKCILRSRCQYFAAMLAGNNAQNVVALQGYSYTTVHFALCHIYSGASHPPEGISLMELAALADLLGLEGLKEVTSHALKTNYCHNFHKPCSGCIDGILQVLPVALNHALDDLYRKCLRWTCRHYMKVWPTRQFAQLSNDILGRCRQQIVAYLTSETVLNTVLDCSVLLVQLATYRWGGICENIVRDILDACYAYIADHFASLIASDSFLSLGHDRSTNIPSLENVLLRTASNLSADQACRSYQRITRLNTVLQAKIIQMPTNLGELSQELQGLQEEELDWDPEYIRLVSALLSAVEQCLIRQCSRAMRVAAWQRMDLDLRKKIQTLARLTEPLDLKRNNAKTVSKAFSFGGSTRNQDLYQVRLAIQAHSKKAMAQESQLYKATQTVAVGGVQTTERGVQATHDMKNAPVRVLKSNSRAHVPMCMNSDMSENVHLTQTSDRRSLPLASQRRTQSEVSSKVIKVQKQENKKEAKPKIALKISDVRPRYLDPRKPRVLHAGSVKSATVTGILTSNKSANYHSSDSSRNSSPAASKCQERTKNKSLDNLSSPSRTAKSSSRGKTSGESLSNTALHGDSIVESMKNSVTTNETISQESLASGLKCSMSNLRTHGRSNITEPTHEIKINEIEAKNVVANNKGALKNTKSLNYKSKISTGSSPSSVVTNKSTASRLSSVSSNQSSRDLYKHRSISVPASKDTTEASNSNSRFSFLSAKSREILAKRAEKNKQEKLTTRKHQEHQTTEEQGQIRQKSSLQNLSLIANSASSKSTKGPLRSSSYSAVTNLSQQHQSKVIQPSNIPMRRPNSLATKSNPMSNTVKSGNDYQFNKSNLTKTSGNAVNLIRKNSGLVDNNSYKEKKFYAKDIEHNATTKESKLERSSTFCKESADLETNELLIIE